MPLDRSFLSLLSMRVTWAKYQGEDKWGNETYADPRDIACFYEPMSSRFGGEDDERQENESVTTTILTTDALGIGLKDKFTFGGGKTLYATDVATSPDEDGTDLYQEVTVSTEKKG